MLHEEKPGGPVVLRWTRAMPDSGGTLKPMIDVDLVSFRALDTVQCGEKRPAVHAMTAPPNLVSPCRYESGGGIKEFVGVAYFRHGEGGGRWTYRLRPNGMRLSCGAL